MLHPPHCALLARSRFQRAREDRLNHSATRERNGNGRNAENKNVNRVQYLFHSIPRSLRAEPLPTPRLSRLTAQTLLGYKSHKPIRIQFSPFAPVAAHSQLDSEPAQRNSGKCNQFQISKIEVALEKNANCSSSQTKRLFLNHCVREDVTTAGPTQWRWRRRCDEFE